MSSLLEMNRVVNSTFYLSTLPLSRSPIITLKVVSWNAHSLRNKYTEILILISLSIDIILVSKSWLTCDMKFDIPRFSIYRSDRSRGGVALFIRSFIPHFTQLQTRSQPEQTCLQVAPQIIQSKTSSKISFFGLNDSYFIPIYENTFKSDQFSQNSEIWL